MRKNAITLAAASLGLTAFAAPSAADDAFNAPAATRVPMAPGLKTAIFEQFLPSEVRLTR